MRNPPFMPIFYKNFALTRGAVLERANKRFAQKNEW